MKNVCNQTQDAQHTKNLAILNDKKRQILYWLLVFPIDIDFENEIFSLDNRMDQEGTKITRNLVKFKLNGANSCIKQDLCGAAYCWKISDKEGKKKVKATVKKQKIRLMTIGKNALYTQVYNFFYYH